MPLTHECGQNSRSFGGVGLNDHGSPLLPGPCRGRAEGVPGDWTWCGSELSDDSERAATRAWVVSSGGSESIQGVAGDVGSVPSRNRFGDAGASFVAIMSAE